MAVTGFVGGVSAVQATAVIMTTCYVTQRATSMWKESRRLYQQWDIKMLWRRWRRCQGNFKIDRINRGIHHVKMISQLRLMNNFVVYATACLYYTVDTRV